MLVAWKGFYCRCGKLYTCRHQKMYFPVGKIVTVKPPLHILEMGLNFFLYPLIILDYGYWSHFGLVEIGGEFTHYLHDSAACDNCQGRCSEMRLLCAWEYDRCYDVDFTPDAIFEIPPDIGTLPNDFTPYALDPLRTRGSLSPLSTSSPLPHR